MKARGITLEEFPSYALAAKLCRTHGYKLLVMPETTDLGETMSMLSAIGERELVIPFPFSPDDGNAPFDYVQARNISSVFIGLTARKLPVEAGMAAALAPEWSMATVMMYAYAYAIISKAGSGDDTKNAMLAIEACSHMLDASKGIVEAAVAMEELALTADAEPFTYDDYKRQIEAI